MTIKSFNPKTIYSKYDWQQWLNRPFFAFIPSLFEGSNTKKYYKKIGLPQTEYDAWVFDHGYWYESNRVFENIEPSLEKWLKKHSISEVTDRLERFYNQEKKIIQKYAQKPEENLDKKIKHFQEVMRICTTYIFLAHSLEYHFNKLLKPVAIKHVSADKVDEFIRLATSPQKLTATEKMDKALLSGRLPKQVVDEFGWIRCRDGFADPFSEKDILDYKKTIKPAAKHHTIKISQEIRPLFNEAKELVYFRTQRTDVWIELLYLSRPILKALAKKYSIGFSDLKYYTLSSLINGKPRQFPKKFGVVGYKGKAYYFDKPQIVEEKHQVITEIKGNIAQKGIAKGTVKVVVTVKDMSKVKAGDIMVTFMTSPNFMPAMRLAGAFVTDEGGLTCHAAIVAREMKKPCVIGTKVATKTFKDGDIVEVNANTGIVKKVN